MPEENPAISALLQSLRIRAGMTAEAMAAELKIPITTYQYYESTKYKKNALPGSLYRGIVEIFGKRGITTAESIRLLGISPQELQSMLYAEEPMPLQSSDGYFEVSRLVVTEDNEHELVGRRSAVEPIEEGDLTIFSWEIIKHISSDPNNLRVARVNGEGMAPTIQKGDLILIDLGRTTPSPPGIFLIFNGVHKLPRRIELIPGERRRLLISADNRNFPSYETSEDVQIEGRVVWLGRDLL